MEVADPVQNRNSPAAILFTVLAAQPRVCVFGSHRFGQGKQFGALCRAMRRTQMRRSSSQVLRNVLAIFFGVAVLGLTVLNAQVDTGSITGVVTDASGAVVSGAKVTLTNQGTGAALTTTSGADGVFKFSPVRVGTYKVEVASQGFQTTTQTGVKVDIGTNVA